MRIICEDFECDWVHHLPLIVLREVQLYQIVNAQGLAIDGVGTVFQEPWENVVDVEDCAFRRTHWGLEGL